MDQAENTNGYQSPDCGELDWLAFQYIAGELSVEDAASFEQRLMTDQFAREAVARAVELAESTAAAFELVLVSPSDSAKRQWLRPAIFAAYGTAAALAIVVTLAGLMQPSSNFNGNFRPIADGNGEVRELAMAWANTRANLASETSDSVVEVAPIVDSSAVDPSVVELSAISGDESDSIETPSWMLFAVASLSENGAGAGEQEEKVLE